MSRSLTASVDSLPGRPVVHGDKARVGTERLLLIELGHLGDPALGNELKEGVDKENSGGTDDGDGEVTALIRAQVLFENVTVAILERGLEDGDAEEGEAGSKLNGHEDDKDEDGQEVLVETSESVLLGSTHITAVDHVEDLEEDERVENEGEAAHLVSIEGGRIVVFVIKIEDCSVCQHNDQHDADHAESATDDLAVHERSHDVALAGSESLDLFNGLRGGEGEGTEDIHDEVDVDELDRVEDGLLSHAEADKDDNQNRKVAGDLELEEALDVHEDVTAPHDSSHGRVEVIGAKDHASTVAGDGGSALESEADVSSLEGLDIIDALTNNGDALEFRFFFFAGIHALETSDEASLGFGVSTADHTKVTNDASELSLVGQRVSCDALAALLTILVNLLDVADKLSELITVHSDAASITTLNNLE